jgi:hypothetical protein
MMHDRGKSDSAIVAVKPTNNAGQPAAWATRRGKRNHRGGLEASTKNGEALARTLALPQSRDSEDMVEALREAGFSSSRDG